MGAEQDPVSKFFDRSATSDRLSRIIERARYFQEVLGVDLTGGEYWKLYSICSQAGMYMAAGKAGTQSAQSFASRSEEYLAGILKKHILHEGISLRVVK